MESRDIKISKTNSKKINFLNYFLACLIVVLHSCNIVDTVEFSTITITWGGNSKDL